MLFRTMTKKICGIYTLDIVGPDGIIGFYGGKSDDCERRFKSHVSCLKRGKRENDKFQKAYDKYVRTGIAELKLTIRFECSPDELRNAEQMWLDFHFNECPELIYNICPVANSTKSRPHSEAAKEKMRNRWTPERRAQLSASRKGNGLTDEVKAKIGAANRGRVSALKGKQPSATTRSRMSDSAKKRVRQPHSPETRLKIAMARLGKRFPRNPKN